MLHPEQLLYMFGPEFLPTLSGIEALVGEWFCYFYPDLCANLIELICGRHHGAFNDTRMEVVASHQPGGTSIMNIIHWAQMGGTGEWKMFDYGSSDLNKKHYNQTTPPFYDINRIPKTLPIALFYGTADQLVTPDQVEKLINSLPAPPVLVRKIEQYAHLDFVWALDAKVKVYADILNLLKKYS